MKRKYMSAMLAAVSAVSMACFTGCSGIQTTVEASSAIPTSSSSSSTLISANFKPTITLSDAEFSEDDNYTDYTSESYTSITAENNGVSIDGDGAQFSDKVLSITSGGTYVLTGEISDCSIIIDSSEDIRLVLNGFSLKSSTGAAICALNGDVMLSLVPGTENSLEDASNYSYSYYDETEGEPSAAVFAKDDIVINGTGSLKVTSNYNNGIQSKDKLKFVEGTVEITSVDDGIVGKDMAAFKDGTVTINAGGDGIKATNTEAGTGFVAIGNGTYNITGVNDGIQAETCLYIEGGNFEITTSEGGGTFEEAAASSPMQGGMGGGQRPERTGNAPTTDGTVPFDRGNMPADKGISPNDTSPADVPTSDATTLSSDITTTGSVAPQEETESTSAKALKAGTEVSISGGTFNISSTDDSIHSNGNTYIAGGTFILNSGDDGIHSDNETNIYAGIIKIENSYEGIEGLVVNISGGDISLNSVDDGINSAGGNDGSSNSFGMMDTNESNSINISGGTINVNAYGDGLDSNGYINISDGNVFVSGPTNSGNGALDYGIDCIIDGGEVVIAGSNGMAQAPSYDSSQMSIAGAFDEVQSAGTTVSLADENGNEILSYTSAKEYQFIIFSSSLIESGKTYTITVDGETLETITSDSTVTYFSEVTGDMGRGMGHGGGMGGGRSNFNGEVPDATSSATSSQSSDKNAE